MLNNTSISSKHVPAGPSVVKLAFAELRNAKVTFPITMVTGKRCLIDEDTGEARLIVKRNDLNGFQFQLDYKNQVGGVCSLLSPFFHVKEGSEPFEERVVFTT